MEIYEEFARWLDALLENNDMPANTAAFNFNLYEEEDEAYGIQLIAADEFSDDDDDWACSEVWSSEEDVFYIDHSDEENADAERGIEFIGGLIRDYLENGAMSTVLRKAEAVCCGFVDGALTVIYKKDAGAEN